MSERKVFYFTEKLEPKELFLWSELDKIDRDLAFAYTIKINKGSFEKPDTKQFHSWETDDFKFSEGDALAVASLINNYPENSVFVEMGVWKGWSTSLIFPKLKKEYKYYCIDWFKGSPTEACEGADSNVVRKLFEKRLLENGIIDKVHILEGDSVSVAKTDFKDGEIDVFFLDGAHVEPYFSDDVIAWHPKIKVGGIFSGHDWNTVGGVAEQLFTRDMRYEKIDLPEERFGKHCVWAYKKVK